MTEAVERSSTKTAEAMLQDFAWNVERIILRRFRENKIDGYTKPMSEEIAALFTGSVKGIKSLEHTKEQLLEAIGGMRGDAQAVASTGNAPAPSVNEYARDYEYRGDQDYTPTDGERAMIEDAIEGYLHLMQAAATQPAPEPAPSAGADRLSFQAELSSNTRGDAT